VESSSLAAHSAPPPSREPRFAGSSSKRAKLEREPEEGSLLSLFSPRPSDTTKRRKSPTSGQAPSKNRLDSGQKSPEASESVLMGSKSSKSRVIAKRLDSEKNKKKKRKRPEPQSMKRTVESVLFSSPGATRRPAVDDDERRDDSGDSESPDGSNDSFSSDEEGAATSRPAGVVQEEAVRERRKRLWAPDSLAVGQDGDDGEVRSRKRALPYYSASRSREESLALSKAGDIKAGGDQGARSDESDADGLDGGEIEESLGQRDGTNPVGSQQQQALRRTDSYRKQFLDDGSGTKPIHAQTLHFAMHLMEQKADEAVTSLAAAYKRDGRLRESRQIRVTADEHFGRVLERVRRRLRTTNLPESVYVRAADLHFENMRHANHQRRQEIDRAADLADKLVLQRQQLEKQHRQLLTRHESLARTAEHVQSEVGNIHPAIAVLKKKKEAATPREPSSFRPAPKGSMALLCAAIKRDHEERLRRKRGV
jgi:hypothetical protein